MHDSVLDEIFATMLASASSETHTTVSVTGGEVTHSSHAPVGLMALPPMKHYADDPWSVAKVAVGKTVDIGNKEKARVSLSISAACRRSKQQEAHEALSGFVWALLSREVHAVTNPLAGSKPTPDFPLSQGDSPRLYLYIEYGLTMYMGNWEFTKPSVGSGVSTDPDHFRKDHEGLAKFLGGEIVKQVALAKAPAPKF